MKRSVGLRLLAAALVAGCGGGGGGGGQEPMAEVVVSGPMQVAPRGQIQWTVHMPSQPANDPPTGYAINLPEAAAGIDIRTEPCTPPATTGCQRWTLTAAADAVPGKHAFEVAAVGLRGSQAQPKQVELDLSIGERYLARALQVVADGGSVLVVARTDPGEVRLFGRGDNRRGQLASGYLRPAGSNGGDTQAGPGRIEPFIPLRHTVALGSLDDLVAQGQGMLARRGAAVHGWGDNTDQRLGFATPAGSPAIALQPQAVADFDGAVRLTHGSLRVAVMGAEREVLVRELDRTNEQGERLDRYRVAAALEGQGRVTPLRDVMEVADVGLRLVLLQADGTLLRWRFPNGSRQEAATRITGLPAPMRALAAFGDQVIARDDAGRLWMWREAETPTDPVQVPGLDEVVSHSVVDSRAWAVRRDGSVWSWPPGGTPARTSALAHAVSVSGDGWVITNHCSEGEGGLWRLDPAAQPVAQRQPSFGVDCGVAARPVLSLRVRGQGSVVSSPAGLACSGPNGECASRFAAGTTVELEAVGLDNRAVLAWTGDCQVTTASRDKARVTLAADGQSGSACAVAFAERPSPLLTVAVLGPGSVRMGGAFDLCHVNSAAIGGCHSAESPLTLVALPAPGARFVGWSGACSGANATLVHNTTGRQSCTASFENVPPPATQATLTVQSVGNGSVSSQPAGQACGTACLRVQVTVPGSITLTAAPAAGQRFAGWGGACSGMAATLVQAIGANAECSARFEALPAGPAPLPSGNLVQNPGFEREVAAGGLPLSEGAWIGDATLTVAAEQGIAPRSGNAMLKFVATGPVATINLVSSQLWQVVDLSPWADAVAAGDVVADASAWFNRVIGNAGTDRRFDLRVLAFDGPLGELAARYAANRAMAVQATVLDSRGADWQQASLSLRLPATTRYLLVEIYAYEDVRNDATLPEFDGHYADDVSLQLRR